MNNLSSLSHIKNSYYKLRSKTKFHIREKFDSYWEFFLKTFPNLKIRPIIHEEIKRLDYVVQLSLAILYMNANIVITISSSLTLVKVDFVHLVVTDML